MGAGEAHLPGRGKLVVSSLTTSPSAMHMAVSSHLWGGRTLFTGMGNTHLSVSLCLLIII